jgi:predicted RNA-binding protein with PUA-like domain
MTNYWLMKSEPETYSIADLKKDKATAWEGVRNFQARNFMKAMKKGDLVLFYHSNCDDKGVVGVGTVSKEAYPDASAQNSKSQYYDPRAKTNPEIWMNVELAWKQSFSQLVSLDQIKKHKDLQNMRLVQKGNRLSVFPVSKSEFETIVALGN